MSQYCVSKSNLLSLYQRIISNTIICNFCDDNKNISLGYSNASKFEKKYFTIVKKIVFY